jgi:hypothetical protein
MLVLAVLAVWGIVLWRVFGRDDAPVAVAARVPVAAGAEDTLLLDYPDPFMAEVVVKPTPVVPQQEAPALPPVQHRLRYLGRISRDGAAYGLVEINGSLHTLRRGEAVEGYRLETLWQDSVRLRWRNEACVARL